jgi:hypothetical protein
MVRSYSGRRVPAVLAACVAAALSGMASAQASVLVNTSDALPLLGIPYTTPGVGCFVSAAFCVEGGSFTLTSLVPGGFVQTGTGELITTNATYTGDLSHFPSGLPAGTITLTGTIEQEVLGRLNMFDTGSWTDDLVSMSLSGVLGGHTLTLGLNPAHTSSGTTSIAQDGAFFAVTSFFDVFAELTLDTSPPLHATPGPVVATAGVPEPATLALLAGPLLAMSAVRRRRT